MLTFCKTKANFSKITNANFSKINGVLALHGEGVILPPPPLPTVKQTPKKLNQIRINRNLESKNKYHHKKPYLIFLGWVGSPSAS